MTIFSPMYKFTSWKIKDIKIYQAIQNTIMFIKVKMYRVQCSIKTFLRIFLHIARL